ncbi:HlyD family type I secretion periplasmic adaptor subunit [Telmatospirillum sp. J64-1]|uniref:HlyD family type I secretion periplasmic adaptor subunit n=1 Tax=Telmatospirillum sp. J64-1 TaxID=2502183 RepID=UPI00115DC982|nr:HlyD family type I secretion periplasmic adaptor subunit [Telmatospirillum sp. J64-1]
MTTASPPAGSAELRPIRRGGRQIRYLAQFVLLEERGMSWLASLAVAIVCAIVLAFLVWAHFMQVDEVAVTTGSVVPRTKVHVVQHLEGGIVQDVLVRDREMVEAGQPLVRLHPVQAEAELEQVRARQVGLRLRAERLRAFAEGREPDFSFADDRYSHLVRDQIDIHRANLERWSTRRAVLLGELAQEQAEMDAASRQITATRSQLALLAEEVEMRRTLFDAGHATKIAFFEISRQHAAMESEISRLEGQRETAQRSVEELRERLIDLDSNMRQDALGELGTVTAELSQLNEAIGRLEDQVRRLDVLSPARGFVQNLQVRNGGAVVPAGGLLMEVVPVDDELLVEAKLSPRDIGHVHEGQPVTVKFATYDFVRYGSVPGQLESVSATTYVDEKDGQPYYRGLVRLDRSYVGNDPDQNAILPGMTVQADILTGQKTLLQYLLKPIHVSLTHAFRER